ncbi:MAG: ribosome assembly cofactor RimP [Paludibacteraceae bacterium]|nr:ribosome assembly cofactor RimP [Paludibacteraceae bacterium]
MIDVQKIQEMVVAYLEGSDCVLVNAEVSPANAILVEIDSYKGVDVDFCAALSRHIQEQLDRDEEDYELEVGSVSITDPFRTKMQYEKNVGHDVEILTRDGRKLHGVLVNVEDDGFDADVEVLVQVEGKKKKQREIQTLHFGYDDVKYCKYDLKV